TGPRTNDRWTRMTLKPAGRGGTVAGTLAKTYKPPANIGLARLVGHAWHASNHPRRGEKEPNAKCQMLKAKPGYPSSVVRPSHPIRAARLSASFRASKFF